jgi:putative tryptophan/tyrosine transport system substrate-binding protein
LWRQIERKGGNATGFVNIEDSVAGKWLELLKELAPQTSRVSLPFNNVRGRSRPWLFP